MALKTASAVEIYIFKDSLAFHISSNHLKFDACCTPKINE